MFIHVSKEIPKTSDDVLVAVWNSKNEEYELRVDYYNLVINRWGLAKPNLPVVYWMPVPSILQLPHPLN